jgi:hypothetical protein
MLHPGVVSGVQPGVGEGLLVVFFGERVELITFRAEGEGILALLCVFVSVIEWLQGSG